jgi:transcriptional regulator with XRE-family HTH domain
MTDPRSFGAWLRRERERRGITVRTIADRTKIGSGLLESLERGDVSRWPAGIYRRAFVRSYADVVGLDAELVLANFERLFPDPDATPGPASESASKTDTRRASGDRASDAGELRLHLDSRPVLPGSALVKRAGLDVAFALGMGVLGFATAGAIGFWCATAVSALVYHVCGVIGIRRESPRPLQADVAEAPAALTRAGAPVVQFVGVGERTARRGRARRLAATLTAAAFSSGHSRGERVTRA